MMDAKGVSGGTMIGLKGVYGCNMTGLRGIGDEKMAVREVS